MNNKLVAFWLVPNKEQKKILEKTIRKLAKKTNCLPFEPHITLFVTKKHKNTKFYKDILFKTAKNFEPISLLLYKLCYEQIFTKSAYFHINKTKKLLDLFAFLNGFFSNSDFEFKPHLSLLYSNLSELEKKRLTKDVPKNKHFILFDTIKLIEINFPVENNKDIESLDVIATKDMSS